MLKRLKTGDTIVFDSVSRMSRNAEDGYKTYMELYSKGINLVFLKERHIDTDTYKESTEQLQRMMGQELHISDNDLSEMVRTIMKALENYQMKMLQRNIQLAFLQIRKRSQRLATAHERGFKNCRPAWQKAGINQRK